MARTAGAASCCPEYMERISSKKNPVIVQIRELKKRAARDTLGLVFLEGERLVMEAAAASSAARAASDGDTRLRRLVIRTVCFSESYSGGSAFGVIINSVRDRGVRIIKLPDALFGYVSDTVTPQGVLAVAEMYDYTLDDLLSGKKGRRRLLLLDGVADPGNAGSMLRTAQAAAFSGALFSEGCVDAYAPKTLRAAMGAVFRIPFLRGVRLREVIGVLKDGGFNVYASAAAKNENFSKDRRGPQYLNCFTGDYDCGDVALIIGGEAFGVGAGLVEMCDAVLYAPMPGGAESLNAGAAAGILMYEFVRRDLQSMNRGG